MRDPALILVVDDNEANVDILVTRLEASGYAVIAARDGEEAIERAHAERPDLILLDVMMPKIDGFEVARRLKGDTSLPFMPIIHVTAKSDSRDVVQGLDAGGDEFLTKPIDHAALLARVRAILRTKALHDQVEAQAQVASTPEHRTRRAQPHLGATRRGASRRIATPRPPEAISLAAGRRPDRFLRQRAPAGKSSA